MKAAAKGSASLCGMGGLMRSLRTIGFMLVYLFGQQPASAICSAGAGATPECRYIAVCKFGGVSQNSCSCSFKLAEEAFPKEQIGEFVEVFEAYANNDSQRAKAILSRHGLGVIEFNDRLNSVMNVASTKCGR